jgi:hypothetical protein
MICSGSGSNTGNGEIHSDKHCHSDLHAIYSGTVLQQGALLGLMQHVQVAPSQQSMTHAHPGCDTKRMQAATLLQAPHTAHASMLQATHQPTLRRVLQLNPPCVVGPRERQAAPASLSNRQLRQIVKSGHVGVGWGHRDVGGAI